MYIRFFIWLQENLKDLTSSLELSMIIIGRLKNLYSMFNRTDDPTVSHRAVANDLVLPKEISEIEERAGGDAEIHSFHVAAHFPCHIFRTAENYFRAIAAFGLWQNDEEAHAVKEAIRGRI